MDVDAINALIDAVNGWLYGYVLVALLVAGGIYFTVRLQFLPTTILKERNGRYVERVIEAQDRRDAFKIAQRHHVNPVKVTEGAFFRRRAILSSRFTRQARFQSAARSRGGSVSWG